MVLSNPNSVTAEFSVERIITLAYFYKLEYYFDLPALCLAIYPKAQAAASFTPGSNSSRHITRASNAPQSTTDWASWGECLATARNTNAAAFL